MTEIELRNKVVSVAKTFLGYNEANGQDDIIIKKYNSIKPVDGYTMKMNDSWCAAFASVVGNVAELSKIIPIECSCQRMIEKFKAINCWEEDGTKIPKIGDYIFYNWDDSTQPNDGWANHVGIVVGVTGRVIKVIEGNKNDAVEYRTISVGWGYIRGYGQPNYASLANTDTIVKPMFAIGDCVNFKGTTHYTSSYANAMPCACKPGKAQITSMSIGRPHPYHLIGIDGDGGSTVYGWVDSKDITGEVRFDPTEIIIKKGDKVKVKNNVTYAGLKFKQWYDEYDVIEVSGNRVVIGKGKTATCAIHIDNIVKV